MDIFRIDVLHGRACEYMNIDTGLPILMIVVADENIDCSSSNSHICRILARNIRTFYNKFGSSSDLCFRKREPMILDLYQENVDAKPFPLLLSTPNNP
ncbi:hypothetical protein RIR_jg28872.t1 [Rhizophagus irregularis DAOM 181602=DAOM 197198]|nr:hypothetical protein RIR_jg28872.t1 [Rhizophagus irregularis DAOM 181602=DAOM 197198]